MPEPWTNCPICQAPLPAEDHPREEYDNGIQVTTCPQAGPDTLLVYNPGQPSTLR